MQLELNHDEIDILAHLLQERCRELRFEIAHTDHRQYRKSLDHRLEVLESVLARMETKEAPTRSVEVA